jgi:hypothetical protein
LERIRDPWLRALSILLVLIASLYLAGMVWALVIQFADVLILFFFGWLVAFMASMATIGLIPTVPLFVIAFMRIEAREPWKLVIPQALALTVFIHIVFDQLLTIPWPPTLLGGWFPAMKFIPSV